MELKLNLGRRQHILKNLREQLRHNKVYKGLGVTLRTLIGEALDDYCHHDDVLFKPVEKTVKKKKVVVEYVFYWETAVPFINKTIQIEYNVSKDIFDSIIV